MLCQDLQFQAVCKRFDREESLYNQQERLQMNKRKIIGKKEQWEASTISNMTIRYLTDISIIYYYTSDSL